MAPLCAIAVPAEARTCNGAPVRIDDECVAAISIFAERTTYKTQDTRHETKDKRQKTKDKRHESQRHGGTTGEKCGGRPPPHRDRVPIFAAFAFLCGLCG